MKHFVLTLFLVLMSLSVQALGFDHSHWDNLLKKHVVSTHDGASTQVDYGGFFKDKDQLNDYLKSLEKISQGTFNGWLKSDQLAFLINAYNAWTVELVLTKYPDIESIKDLGSWLQSPWGKSFIPLLGKVRSLDDIEHGLIRAEGAYQDPRIHFAVNCASVGCPALSPEAYRGKDLSNQLDRATNLFLSDSTRNRLQGDTLKVSKIFKWYREDFERDWSGYKTLEQFFISHRSSLELSENDILGLNTGAINIEYLDYDWDLNRKL